MRRRGGVLLMALGALLILAALALLQYNRWDNDRAGSGAQAVLEALQEEMEELQAETEISDSGAAVSLPIYRQQENAEMETIEIDGYEYIGILTIPILDLELPVMAEWSYAGLKIAPGHYSGSVWTDDFVICAHNYKYHFGTLKYLEPGATLYFTDVNGTVFQYEVGEVVILEPTDIETMIESEWDLTLFTCTYGGRTRVTVRCARIDP